MNSTSACQRCFKPQSQEWASLPGVSLCKACSYQISQVEHFLAYVGWTFVPKAQLNEYLEKSMQGSQNGSEKAGEGPEVPVGAIGGPYKA